jgi:5-methylcytosine-specific restriction endonuclease McrA
MALSRTAKFYRDNPSKRKKHQKTSSKWNKSAKGKAYKKAKNATPEERKKRKLRDQARRMLNAKKGQTVEHVKPLSKGGTNKRSNLKIVSPKENYTKNKK